MQSNGLKIKENHLKRDRAGESGQNIEFFPAKASQVKRTTNFVGPFQRPKITDKVDGQGERSSVYTVCEMEFKSKADDQNPTVPTAFLVRFSEFDFLYRPFHYTFEWAFVIFTF